MTKNAHAVALAKRRSATMTPQRRSEIARKAARARWGKLKTKEFSERYLKGGNNAR